uniref:Uncharacterized protein n=1 Tax=Helicobacter pylori TaxID=210 RepID=B5A867_HELPX|nr:unknown [Helicobacter pylori]
MLFKSLVNFFLIQFLAFKPIRIKSELPNFTSIFRFKVFSRIRIINI